MPHRSPESRRRRVSALAPWTLRVAAVLVTAATAAFESAAADFFWREDPRLFWREDPRPPGDFPSGVTPPDWQPSRRAMRRANRRGIQLEPPARTTVPPAPPTTRAMPPRVVPTPGPPPGRPPVAAAPATPAVTTASTASDSRIIHRSQPYGDHPRQQFDLHLPASCTGGGLPLVIWIPGTDWKTAPREPCPVAWLVDRGYAVASIGYRTSDTVVFPAPLEDCRAAVMTLVRDAEIWGVDPARIAVIGAAAGGHLASLVGFTEWPADPTGEPADGAAADRELVAAVGAIGAPTHLVSLGGGNDRGGSAASRLVGGPLPEVREAALAASPLTHVSPQAPPTLLVHGVADTVIPAEQAIRLDKALVAAGVDSTLVLVDGGHDVPLVERSPAGAALLGFLDRVLGPGMTLAD
jgi:acetyl esterase/lipase